MVLRMTSCRAVEGLGQDVVRAVKWRVVMSSGHDQSLVLRMGSGSETPESVSPECGLSAGVQLTHLPYL